MTRTWSTTWRGTLLLPLAALAAACGATDRTADERAGLRDAAEAEVVPLFDVPSGDDGPAPDLRPTEVELRDAPPPAEVAEPVDARPDPGAAPEPAPDAAPDLPLDAAAQAEAAAPEVADVPSPDVPSPDVPSPDVPSPDVPSPDMPSPDVPVQGDATPDAAPEVDPGPVYGPAGTPLPVLGFGQGTLGGWQEGHDTYLVTSLADDGPGTLREGLRSNGDPRVVLFEVDGVIPLQAPLLVPSNITVDGRGRSVVLTGKGLVVPGSDQVILTNLALEDLGPAGEDGVQIGSALPDPSEYVVLDHLRFTQHGDNGNCEDVDEAVSVIYGSRNLTFAWLRFQSWEKVLLAGNGDAEPALDAQITLTWHHSYAVDTGRRHPQARHGRFHLVNNVFDGWRMYGWEILSPYHESFGAQVQDDGRMLLEGQMVRRFVHADDWLSLGGTVNDASRCESGGDLLELGTWTHPATTAALKFGTGCAHAQAFDVPYAVVVEPAGPALWDEVVAGAGNTL